MPNRDITARYLATTWHGGGHNDPAGRADFDRFLALAPLFGSAYATWQFIADQKRSERQADAEGAAYCLIWEVPVAPAYAR